MKELSELRKAIDEVDDRIVELLNKRAEIAKKVGKLKRKRDIPFYVPGRESKLLDVIESKNRFLDSESIRAIFREIISACRSLEEPTRVAYLGPKATFTHLAALKHFGTSSNLEPKSSIEEVFDEVEKERVDYGVVPIENSIEGVVSYTIDMFMDTSARISGEVLLPINLHLLSMETELSNIKRVYSHRHAVAQSRKWLAKNLKDVEVVETLSTAVAAQRAVSEPQTAAIASEAAARLFDLNILARNIQEIPNNFTRFLIIGRKDSEIPTGKDKTSIMFSTKHRSGALFNALKPFALYDVNLSKIESRPAKKRPWEYVFFVDLEGHRKDERVAKALSEIGKSTSFFKVLGSYPRGC